MERDIIYKLNNCPIKNNEDWYDCILHAVQHSTPGYCVKQSFIQVIYIYIYVLEDYLSLEDFFINNHSSFNILMLYILIFTDYINTSRNF